MYRSFTDRILGGVCGGLAVDLHLNPWTLRIAFIVLTLLSLGFAALIYVALWWAMPLESLLARRRGSLLRTLFVLVVIVTMAGAWAGHQMGWLRGSTDQEILWPVTLLIMSTVFLLRQVRG